MKILNKNNYHALLHKPLVHVVSKSVAVQPPFKYLPTAYFVVPELHE